MSGLAPSEVAERRDRPPEGRELVARAARVVGDDGLSQVYRVQKVPDHAVGVEGRVAGGELGLPPLQPRLPGLLDLLGHRSAVAPGLAQPLLHLGDQRLQHQPGVPHQPVVNGHIFGEVGGIHRSLHDYLVLGHADVVGGAGKAASDSENDVGLAQEFPHRRWVGAPARAQREAVILRKGALARQAGGHRRAQ